MSQTFSSLFISHGAPTLPMENSPARRFLESLGQQLPKPSAIVVLSPHWMTRGLEVKSPERFETWHDFGGFPEELYRLKYTPRGEPVLATRVLELLRGAGMHAQPSADVKLDHGVWVPLLLMFPQADIPLVQVSATWDTPKRYRELGQTLGPLAKEGVLILGSGGLVHNLREIVMDSDFVPDWARNFEQWAHAKLEAGDWDSLCEYRKLAPDAARAHPTEDHYLPLYFAGGAGGESVALHRSFAHGGLSMATYAFK